MSVIDRCAANQLLPYARPPLVDWLIAAQPSTSFMGTVREMQDEGSYVCDACGEVIVAPVDLSAGSSQRYVEDCPVCCRPSVIHVEIDEDGVVQVWGEAEQDHR